MYLFRQQRSTLDVDRMTPEPEDDWTSKDYWTLLASIIALTVLLIVLGVIQN